MGWERKRGKLAEFNRLLRGATDTSFVVVHGDCRVAARDQVRHHARFRHAPADGGGTPPGRHPVASAQPAAVRCAPAARHRRVRRAAAARAGQHRERGPHAVRAGLLRATSASIRTPPRCPTCTRTCSTRAATSARASTTSTRSRRRSPDGCPRTRCSATTSSRACTRARGCAPTSTWWTTTPRTTWRSRRASTAGSAATGRSSAGSGARCPTRTAARCRTRFPPSRAGRFSTTSAAACSRRRSSRSSSPGGRSCPGPRSSGRSSASWCSRFPPTCRSAAR